MNKFGFRRETLLTASTATIVTVLSGCATPAIESKYVETTIVAPNPGFAYALPKARVEITAERKEVTDDGVSKADAAAQAAGSALKAATVRSEEANAGVKGLKEIFDKAQEPGRTELLKQLTVAQAVAAVVNAAKKAAEEEFNQKSDEFQQIKAKKGWWLEKASVKVLASVPDPNARFVVNRTPGLTRDDDLKLTVTNGLLNSSDATTTDQTAAILISLAQIGSAGAPRAGGPRGRLARVDPIDKSEKPCTDYQLVLRFDPTDAEETKYAMETLHTRSGGTLVLVVNGNKQFRLENKDIRDCRLEGSMANCLASPEKKAPGLLYRGLSNVEVTVYPAPLRKEHAPVPKTRLEQIESCRKGEALPFLEASTSALVPDSNSLYVLPHEAGAFVKTTHAYTFKDGIPVEFGFKEASQLAAILRVPVDMAKAIVEIPAELIKLRVDYDNSANNLLLQQINALENQVKLLNAQQKLEERVAQER